MIGDWLYKVLERDLALIEPFYWARNPAASAAALITQTVALPSDRVLFIHGFAFTMTAGAAQFPSRISLELIDATRFTLGNPLLFVQDMVRPAPAAAAIVGGYAEINTMVPSNAVLGVNGVFNAGVANNQINFTVHGFLLPRGNLTVAAF